MATFVNPSGIKILDSDLVLGLGSSRDGNRKREGEYIENKLLPRNYNEINLTGF